jgi:hypothetical protein
MSIVRENLMTDRGYTPYCGAANCRLRWPRAHFNGQQFACHCGWESRFDPAFIAEYKAKWGLAGTTGAAA